MDAPPSQIIPFLEAQTFFITGITGKVLLYKLLSTCPNIKDKGIYVLVRGKKEMTAEARFEKDILATSLLFTPETKVGQLARQKIKVIDGDISKSKLGLSAVDYAEVTQNCTVVLHMAATVNFNENLRLSVELNVLGSRRVLDLAKKCKNLLSFTHCSTCYVNTTRFGSGEVREKIYPITFDPFAMTDKIVAMTLDEAEKATPHLIGGHPNTYTFTKSIAEHILMEEKGDVPYAIVRPSIIGGAWAEPLPGWVDSFIGPAGLSLAAGLGALRVMRGGIRNHLDLVPVDLVANCLLTVVYHTAVNPPRKRLPIYHISTGSKNPCIWDVLRSSVVGNFRRRPSRRQVGYPGTIFLEGSVSGAIAHQLFHVAPAALGDAKLIVTGRNPMYLSKTAQLKSVIDSLYYFTSHEWNFATHNTSSLWESLNSTDATIFNFDTSPRYVDWEEYYVRFCNGMRKYLLKEITPEEKEWLIQSKL